MDIIKIQDDKEIIALIVPYNYFSSGVNFLTSSDSTMQLAIITEEQGHETKKHFHPDFERKISKTMECIFVKFGKLSIDFYDNNEKYIDNYIALTGDVVFIMHGGHFIKYLQKSEIIEIRQGPYNKEFDKIFF